ncbi:hypothetical protein AB5I41_04080 [Sphingomonas sp. MMS24-JH45]
MTGLDLVALQLRLARGERVPDVPRHRGVAIQLRVSAETLAPGGTVRPSTGIVAAWSPAGGPGVRVDAAIVPGMAANPRFDPLLAS